MIRNICSIFLLFISFTVNAQSAVKKELYKSAREHFSKGVYVDALRDFSGFQAANDRYLELHPNLKNAISSAISICESKIEEVRKEEERRKAGIVEIQVDALRSEPGPVYLLTTDSVLSPQVEAEWRGMLYRLLDQPFAALEINCISNADGAARENYVMSRISLFEKTVEDLNIGLDRIQWNVDPSPTDEGYLASCMRYHGPPKGSICLDVRLNGNSNVFDLEP